MKPPQPPAVLQIGSRENPRVKLWRQLAHEGGAYRRQGRVWLEGEHLLQAARARGPVPECAVFSESFWARAQTVQENTATQIIVLPDRLFAAVSALDSPAGCAVVLPLAPPAAIEPLAATVVLDRLQDPGNVGSILRSAAAFGFTQVLALAGTVGLWSPKVLRAGMGAHFSLRLLDALAPAALDALGLPLLETSSHDGEWLHETRLPARCAWLFGHEGQGIDPALSQRLARARGSGLARRVRIAQPGGEESLNVAAAAAICLHASALQAARAAAMPQG